MTSMSSILVLLAALVAVHAATTQLNSRLSGADVDKILSNPRILQNYVKCLVDQGPCTSEAKDIKKILPQALTTSCANCSPQLKANLKKTVVAMKEKHPAEWQQIVAKFDPKKEHAKDLEAFLKSN